MKKDITKLISDIKTIVKKHEIAPGTYARWTMDDGTDRNMGVNEYGCADAANILYTIGAFPKDAGERAAFVQALQKLQNPENGLYVEPTHHTIHTTAHCTAALELFDALPLYPLKGLDRYKTKEGLYQLLDGLAWVDNPWPNSHQGAGIYAALTVTEEATREWNGWYFDWFWNEADPDTGLWRKGCQTGEAPIYAHMAGSFHYLFNHEHAKMPLRYPEKMINTCLDMYYNNKLRADFGTFVGFLEIDWVYCVTRALRQCNYRFEECVEAVTDFAEKYLDYLMGLDPETSEEMDDLHMLFGAVCCIAELQRFLPGCVVTEKPLRLVLDRRPFI